MANGSEDVVEAGGYVVNDAGDLVLHGGGDHIRSVSAGQWIEVRELGIRLAEEWPCPEVDDALVAALNKMADHAALPYGVSGRDFNDWRMNDLDTFVEALVATDGIDAASSDTQHRLIVRDVRAVVAKVFGVTPSSA